MPDLSFAGEWATHFHLSVHASHFVLEGGSLLMPLCLTGTIFTVVVEVASPTVTLTVRGGAALFIYSLFDSCVGARLFGTSGSGIWLK